MMDLAQRLGLVRTGWREISRQSLFCSSVSVSSYALEGDGFLKTQIHVDVHAFVVQHRQSKHSGLPD